MQDPSSPFARSPNHEPTSPFPRLNMPNQRRKSPKLNLADANTSMHNFFGTVGSPINLSKFDLNMERRKESKQIDKQEIPTKPLAAPPGFPEPTGPTAEDDVATVNAKARKVLKLNDIKKPQKPANLNLKLNLSPSPEKLKTPKNEDMNDIATIRQDRGRRGSEFIGAIAQPMEQLRLDGAKKAKIPHFLSAWFNKAEEPPAPRGQNVPERLPTREPAKGNASPARIMEEPESEVRVNNNDVKTLKKQTHEDVKNSTPIVQDSLSSDLNINFKEIELGRTIGEGAFGKVYDGKWRGRAVAIKLLICQELRADILFEFQKEVELMSMFRHPNVCRLLGACMEPPNRAILLELLSRGSLWGVLRQYRKTLDQDRRFRFMYDTAKGMCYLHHFERPILHRDLKSPNLLVDKHFNIKISDFGLARVKAHVQTMTGNCGTVQWMAPEVLGNQKYTEKADVFSFGIVIWEILTGECPYDGMSQIQVGLGVLNRNIRPTVPSNCPSFYARLMKACWNRQPDLRPSFPQIVNAFRTYHSAITEKKGFDAKNSAADLFFPPPKIDKKS